MSYLVFSRKFRPAVFGEVLGQEHVTSTLKRALETGRIGQAYLFAGPRGTGKTTIARILAKAINCEKGVKPDPCNKCISCREISASDSIDVLEIDGASNRRIEEVRNIRENVKFAPARDRFKIYIIDEVHMLTNEAFNALLKTLEEPPEHVKFIFATTAPHKMPLTILSRCQRFDLRSISLENICKRLEQIAKSENIKSDAEALRAISRAASGSMRDAQSIFDQMASASEKKLTEEDVRQTLGLIPEDIFLALGDAVKTSDTLKALQLIDEIIRDGKDPEQFLKSWLEYWRNILLIKSGAEDLSSFPEPYLNRMVLQAGNFSVPAILNTAEILFKAQELMKKTAHARIPLEIAAARLTTPAGKPEPAPAAEKAAREDDFLPGARGEDNGPGEEKVHGVNHDSCKSGKTRSEEISSKWPEILDRVKKMSVRIHGFLVEGAPVSAADGKIRIGFTSSFHKESCEKKENKKAIEKAAGEILKTPFRVECIISPEAAAGQKPEDSREAPDSKEKTDGREKAMKDPAVKKVRETLNLDIIEIKEEEGIK